MSAISDSDMFLTWAAEGEAPPVPQAEQQGQEQEPDYGAFEQDDSAEVFHQPSDLESAQPGAPQNEGDRIVASAMQALAGKEQSTPGEPTTEQPATEQQPAAPGQQPESGLAVKALAEMLKSPANLVDTSKFAQALAQERPEMFNRLVADIAASRMLEGIQKWDTLAPEQQNAVDSAIGAWMTDRLQQKFGLYVDEDSIGQAIGLWIGLRNYAPGRQPYEVVNELVRPYLYPEISPGYQGNLVPPDNVAVAIARELGLAPDDPLVAANYRLQVRAAHNAMQATRQEMANERQRAQVDGYAETLIAKIELPADQKETVKAIVAGKLRAPVFERMRQEIAGWQQEGKPQHAERVAKRYAQAVAKLVGESANRERQRNVANRQPRSPQPQPQQQQPAGQAAPQPRRYRSEGEMLDSIAREGAAMLRSRRPGR